ncbi:MAG: archaeosine synthase subunit alpha [Methanocorpusculum sp.]|nr:archaeosine synthase subunit alpha [Methanocorpusculum sp.]MDE2523947.1 archaeosine synthase subunit alpha [Methanocorpusculum sp.]
MSTFDVRIRDGLARTGMLRIGDAEIHTPAAVEARELFPSLADRPFTNLPLSAPQSDADIYYVPGTDPVSFHPLAVCPAVSGDVVMIPGWRPVLGDARRYAEYLAAIFAGTPPDAARYAPACALPSNAAMLIATGFDLFDYTAVDLASIQGKFCMPEGEFDASYLEKGVCGCEGCRTHNLFLHNRLALEREVAVVKTWIAAGQMRELMEQRCRLHAEQVALLRRLDRSPLAAAALPAVRSSRFLANSAESMTRAEIAFFEERVINRFVPSRSDVCVLLPCAARKPYSMSKTHQKFQKVIEGRAHEVIITSPLGVVPRELELVYPAGHYDVPVTGYWDREESAILTGYVAAYLAKHRYERVICHLEGGAKAVAIAAAEAAGVSLEVTCTDDRPSSPDSLRALNAALKDCRKRRNDPVRGTLAWQFGELVDTKGWMIKGRYPNQKIYEKKTQMFSIDASTGLLRPTMEGWKFLSGYRVRISDGFVPQGDILAPGIASADPVIREGDEVLVEGPGYLATGKAAMGAEEMIRSSRGVAVRVRKTKKS